MNALEFTKNVPAERLAEVFKDYFEQHMAVYELIKGMEFLSINSINVDKASIMYSVKILDEKERNNLISKLQVTSGKLNIYSRDYTPHIFMNGDILCITISK